MQPNDLVSNKLSQYVLDQHSEKVIAEEKYKVVHTMLKYVVNSAWAQFVIENYETGDESKQHAKWIGDLEALSEKLQLKSIADFEKYYSFDLESDWGVVFLTTISDLLDVNYKPPMFCNLYAKDVLKANPEVDPYGLEMRNFVLQLQALDFYYGYMVFTETNKRNFHLDFTLDRALFQLFFQVGVRDLSATKILKEHVRILNGRKGTEKKVVQKNKGLVAGEFEALKKKRPKIIKNSPNYIATQIRSNLKAQDVPISINTVKKYLAPLLNGKPTQGN